MAPGKPLVVIVGPTASGKSELALKIAKKFNGEIICADSRTVYKGMNIGTAKPTLQDQQAIKHHLLDVVEPGQVFTVHDFQRLAETAIADIRGRQKLPILVGGSGLYIDSVIFDYSFPAPTSLRQHQQLDELTVDKLINYCQKNTVVLPANQRNKRHLISAITRNGSLSGKRSEPIDHCIIVGITTNKDILRQRITARAEHLFSHGVVEEARNLGEMYGWNSEAMTANIYQVACLLLKKEISKEEAKTRFITLDYRLAKRQMTWFKRNCFIEWKSLIQAEHFLFALLAKTEQK